MAKASIAVVEANGEVCVDVPLYRRKNRFGLKVSRAAQNVMKIIFDHGGAIQTHNKVPPSVFRVLTSFGSRAEAINFLKERFGRVV